MISAYTYDQGNQILEVAFHRGVYHYTVNLICNIANLICDKTLASP